MKKHARMLFLLFCATILFAFSFTTAAPAHAASAWPLEGGCADNGVIQICITGATFISAYAVLDGNPTSSQITVTIFDTGFGGQTASAGPADCTKTQVSVDM